MRENGSERPPSVRQAELLDDGTLVTLEYDQRGQVVRQSYYWSSDAELLQSILARTLNRDEWWPVVRTRPPAASPPEA